MKNFVQTGETVTLTVPAAGVTSGTPIQIGLLLVVPTVTVAYSASEVRTFTAMVRGVFSVTKVGSQAWAEGALVYWDAGASKFTTTAAGNHLAGHALVATSTGLTETTGVVLFDGTARDDEST